MFLLKTKTNYYTQNFPVHLFL